jgi:hypothetical protein
MNRLLYRIGKVEKALTTKDESFKIFVGKDREDFKRQKEKWLKDGGDPDMLLILVKDFA